MKKLLLHILTMMLATSLNYNLTNAADSEVSSSIVAIVGDEIISTTDLYDRINLTMSISSIEKNQENADSLIPKVLQHLIDEKLILKEAKRLKIDVSQDEIDNVIANIESQNNLSNGGFKELLLQNKIPEETTQLQLKSQILWQKIIGYTIRAKLAISENEIKEVLNTATPGQAEVSFKQILIPVKIFKSEEDLKSQITKLTELRSKVNDCNDIHILAQSIPIKIEVDNITLPIEEIHNDLQNMIRILPIGKASKVIKSKTSLRVIAVCSRDFIGLDNISREEVREVLMQKKLMTQSNHYISNLRKKTFIEVYI